MKNVLLLVEQDFQDLEAMYPYYRLKEAGFSVHVAGSETKEYHGKYGYPIKAESIEKFHAKDIDCVVIPGGWAPDFIRRNEKMLAIISEMNKQNKIIAAICHAGWVLASAKVCKGKTLTCFSAIKDDMINAGANYVDKEVVVDGNLITSRKPDDLPAFCREIINALEK